MSRTPTLQKRTPSLDTLLLAVTGILLVQSAHHLEHVAQVIEIDLFQRPAPHARGLLGAHFDFEWVHLIYNAGLEAAILGILLYALRSGAWRELTQLARGTLGGLAIWQGYHALEHGIKIYQYFFVDWYRFGYHAPAGLLPRLIDQPIFLVHFWLNMIPWALILFLWILLGPTRLLPLLGNLARPLGGPQLQRRAAGAVVSLGVVAWGGMSAVQEVTTIRVPGEAATLTEAVDAALPGWTILVAPGTYTSVRIDKPLVLRSEIPGAALIRGEDDRPLIEIYRVHNVTVEGFELRGGRIGILVEEGELVQLRDNRIRQAWWAGIRLSRSSAEIVGNLIQGSRSRYGMGIELANTQSRPPSLIAYNTILQNPAAGIDLHNAQAQIVGNLVMGNGQRGIAVTEMSIATVRENRVLYNADAGLYVVDMSVVAAAGNQVAGVRSGGLLGRGDAIRLQYYAQAYLAGNRLEAGPSGELVVQSGSTVWQASVPELVPR